MRVLIIEDLPELAEEYFRICGHVLKGDHTLTHVPSIEAALKPMFEENWHVILVDAELGPPGRFQGDPSVPEDGLDVHNGYELVSLRRRVEGDPTIPVNPSIIVGMAPNHAILAGFSGTDVDYRVCKLDLEKMAGVLHSIEKKVTAV